MLWLYRLLFPLLLIPAAPYYLWRMRKRGGYRRGFGQRFGAVAPLPAKRPGVTRIWLQAVSVGEMLAIGPILKHWADDPSVEVYLTTTTSTGHKLALERYAAQTIGIGYFPLDWWPFSRKAWRQIQPDIAVLTEGERWPEHIRQARVHGVPVIAINARLSDRSFRRMSKARMFIQPLMGDMTRILCAATPDAERFRALGFPADRLAVTGNIKLDITMSPLTDEARDRWRTELGVGAAPIVLGSSTWPGEEALILQAYREWRKLGIDCRLVLVPRHAERRNEIRELLERAGERFHFRSTGPAPGPVEVSVADTTGELRQLTLLADLVIVGKSLPPHHEGQTPVEAAAAGKPILFGPEMSNFRVIARELRACGAAQTVSDAQSIRDEGEKILRDSVYASAMAAAANAWHRANQGAVARTVHEIDAFKCDCVN